MDFHTIPSGLELVVFSETRTAPFSKEFIVNASTTVSAPSPQVWNGISFVFDSWSDGGAQSHTITVDAAPIPLVASYVSAIASPTGLTAVGGNRRVKLDWDDLLATDLAGYHVYRSTTSGGGYVRISTGLVGSSAYLDLGVINGRRYFYVVTAEDTSGNQSGYSNEARATPNDSPLPFWIHSPPERF
jgi:hypothetical protein